jgi:hypothetical protein
MAAVRASVAATNAESRFAITEGLKSSLWLEPDDALRPTTPPACNFTSRTEAFVGITDNAETTLQYNIYALTGQWVNSFETELHTRAVFPSPDFSNIEEYMNPSFPEDASYELHRLLRENACDVVSQGQLNGLPFLAPSADYISLGLPPLDCTGFANSLNPSASQVSTGGYRGLGSGGLTTAVETITLRSWILSSVYSNSSSNFNCIDPDMDNPSGSEWSLDAAQWLLIDPGLRLSVYLALTSAKTQLSLLLTVHALMALALPVVAAILYAFWLSPKFSSADSEAKMARAVLLLLPRKALSEVKDFEWLVGRRTIVNEGSSFSNLGDFFRSD